MIAYFVSLIGNSITIVIGLLAFFAAGQAYGAFYSIEYIFAIMAYAISSISFWLACPLINVWAFVVRGVGGVPVMCDVNYVLTESEMTNFTFSLRPLALFGGGGGG